MSTLRGVGIAPGTLSGHVVGKLYGGWAVSSGGDDDFVDEPELIDVHPREACQ